MKKDTMVNTYHFAYKAKYAVKCLFGPVFACQHKYAGFIPVGGGDGRRGHRAAGGGDHHRYCEGGEEPPVRSFR